MYSKVAARIFRACIVFEPALPRRHALGSQCPQPSIVNETKIHVNDTVVYPVYQYATEIKCHSSTS
jgi:hypothetical protein